MIAAVAIFSAFAGLMLFAGILLAIVGIYISFKAKMHLASIAFVCMIFTVSVGLGVVINTANYLLH